MLMYNRATVEAARRLVESGLLDSPIMSVDAQPDGRIYQNSLTNTDISKALLGNAIVKADRRGKYLILRLLSGDTLILHFGMSGSIQIRGEPGFEYKTFKTNTIDWPPKFCKLLVGFENGRDLAFTDARRFGKIFLIPSSLTHGATDPLSIPPLSLLGPDPLLSMPDAQDFLKEIRSRTRTVKPLLLDQTFLAGLGNWMADEVLYQSGIHPSSNTSTLSDEKLLELYRVIQDVVQTAVQVNGNGDAFPPDWIFHARWAKTEKDKKKAKMSLTGKSIQFVTVGGRTSAIDPTRQVLKKKA